MKIKQLLVLLALTAMNLCAMEPEYKPSALELLPEEAKLHIFDFLYQAPTLEQAVQNIQNAAWVNQDFSRLLNDQPLTKKCIDRLMEMFPKQTRKERILTALYLNTAGSRIWLDKNHPEWKEREWKEFAKNLAKKILDGPSLNLVMLRGLLNAPGTTDFIKNYKGDWNNTALMMATSDGHTTLVEKLLAAGADPDMKNQSGRTALMMAALCDYPAIVEKLLDAGADPNIKDTYGVTALKMAASSSHITVVEKLLSAGAQPNIKAKDGWTALMMADHPVIVEKLLDAGADPNKKDIYDKTVLPYARQKVHAAVIKLFEERMKKVAKQ